MAKPKVKRVIPVLENWMSLPVAAGILGMSRQGSWGAVQNHTFKDVMQVPGTGDRPALILVRPREVAALKDKQDRLAAEQAAREAAAAADTLVPVG